MKQENIFVNYRVMTLSLTVYAGNWAPDTLSANTRQNGAKHENEAERETARGNADQIVCNSAW
jgi:hypothetical protein